MRFAAHEPTSDAVGDSFRIIWYAFDSTGNHSDLFLPVKRFRVLLSFLLLILPEVARGQEPAALESFLGEKLRYVVSFLGVAAGEMTISARKASLEGRPAYQFQLWALTNSVFSKVFLVRDYLASWIDPESFQSLRFEAHTVQGRRVKDDMIEFDYDEGVALRNGRSIAIEQATLDSLSSVFYIRTLDLARKDRVELTVVDRRLYPVRVEVQGRETVKTPAGTFETVRVEPKSPAENLSRSGSGLILWLTNDQRRVPVKLKSKFKAGSLVAKLTSIENAHDGDGKSAGP